MPRSHPPTRAASPADALDRSWPRRGAWLAAGLSALTLATVAPPASAAPGWSAASDAVAEGPADAEPEGGYRPISDVALDRAGNAWFAWVQTNDTAASIGAAATQTVRVSTRPPGGAWQAPVDRATAFRAAGSNYDAVRDVEVDVDDAGRPTVAWVVRAATSATVYASTRAIDGSWSAATALGTAAASALDPNVALDVAANGDVVAAWQGEDGVWIARRPAGGAWAPAETVSGTATDVVDTVGVGHDQDGALTVVWRGGSDNATRTVEARHRSSGGAWSAPLTLTDAPGFVSRPAVAVDATGVAVATWGSADGARAAVRPAGASGWSAPRILSSGSANAAADPANALAYLQTGGQGIPSASFDQHGTASVAWPEKSPDSRVATATVSPSGTWGATTTVATGTADNPPQWPRIVPGPDGTASVVWNRAVKLTISPAGAVLTGGEIQAASRSVAGGAWSTPVSYVTPSNGTYGSVSALGSHLSANLSVVGDAFGNVSAGWSPYANASAAPGTRPNRTFGYEAAVSPRLDWTARGLSGQYNLRTWVSYLYSDWASAGPSCPKGLHEVAVSDGATRPSTDDRSSWRLTQTDAWKAIETGKTIVQYQGTIRWVNQAHCIDSRLTNPRLEIAADGQTARLYSDGQASGSMADAMTGNPSTTPVSNARVLDVDLSGTAPRLSGDGTVRSWVRVPAKLSVGAASTFGLDLYSGRDFGFLTISVPTDLTTRTTPDDPPTETPKTEIPNGEAPKGEVPKTQTPTGETKAGKVTGRVKGGTKKGRKRVTITVSKRLGASSKTSYKVKLTKGKRTVATGTLKNRTLKLTVRSTAKKGKKATYARLKGAYQLQANASGKKAKKLATTAITLR